MQWVQQVQVEGPDLVQQFLPQLVQVAVVRGQLIVELIVHKHLRVRVRER